MTSACILFIFALSQYTVESYKFGSSIWPISHNTDLIKQNELRRQIFQRSRNNFVLSAYQNFIILGGSGDLSTTKLIPSLFELYKENKQENIRRSTELIRIPENNSEIKRSSATTDIAVESPFQDINSFDFSINLVARSNWTNEATREKLSKILSKSNKENSMNPSDKVIYTKLVADFLQKCTYTSAATYSTEIMTKILYETEFSNVLSRGKRRNIVYFALPPKQYLPALKSIRDIHNARDGQLYQNNSYIEKKKNILKNDTLVKLIKNQAENEIEKESKYVNKDEEEKREEVDEEEGERNISIVNKQELICINKLNDLNNFNQSNDLDIVLEKPIGYDKETAKEIIDLALSCVRSRTENVWCVDHYLSKEIATKIIPLKSSQNPIILRLFHDFFNDIYISNIDIIFSDTDILHGRSGYFDDSGIINDILQNHLIQLLALICANTENENINKNINEYINKNRNENIDQNSNKNRNENIDQNSNENRNENSNKNINIMKERDRSDYISFLRTNVLNSIIPIKNENVVRGQYSSYLTEFGVKNNSKTETFASCLLKV